MKDTLGDRMKSYEQVYAQYLTPRMPIIMRLDGVAFHTFCRKMEKPFDAEFMEKMAMLAMHLCGKITGAQIAYTQSDEITIFIHPYKRLVSQPWFGGRVQKMVSVSAGIASNYFGQLYKRDICFDSRVFVLPENEVINNFIWRQNDCSRNSLQALSQYHFSQRQLQGKKREDMHEMLHNIGINWNDLCTPMKRGYCAIKKESGWEIDNNIPVFSQDRNYIEQYLEHE